MSNEQNSIYVGNGGKIGNDGFAIDLNLTQLEEALKLAQVQAKKRKFTSKAGIENEVIRIVAWPLKEARQYSTHSVKIDMWEKPATQQETPANSKQSEPKPTTQSASIGEVPVIDDLPF
jgi:hypothetical protein